MYNVHLMYIQAANSDDCVKANYIVEGFYVLFILFCVHLVRILFVCLLCSCCYLIGLIVLQLKCFMYVIQYLLYDI